MDPHKVINFTIFILVLGMFLLLAAQSRQSITGSVIQENTQKISPITEQQIKQEITTADLITLTKQTIDYNFPQSKGAFVKNTRCNNCEIWNYPFEGEIKEQVYVQIQNIKEAAISLDTLYAAGGFTEQTKLANGKILINDREEEYRDSVKKTFETTFICNNQHLVQIGITKLTFQELEEKGAILQTTNTLTDFCANH